MIGCLFESIDYLLLYSFHMHRRTGHGVWEGGGGGGGYSPPRVFQIAIFGGKNQVIFGQNHLIVVQAMEKNIRAIEVSPPERNPSCTPMFTCNN